MDKGIIFLSEQDLERISGGEDKKKTHLSNCQKLSLAGAALEGCGGILGVVAMCCCVAMLVKIRRKLKK